jgi:hypothetical protein
MREGRTFQERLARLMEHPDRSLLPPLTVYAVFDVLDRVRGLLDLSSPDLAVAAVHPAWPPAGTAAVAGEVVSRLTWGLTAGVFLLAWAVAVVVCLTVLARAFSGHRRGLRTILWGAGLVGLAGWAAVGISPDRLPVSIPSLQPLLDVLKQTAPGVEEFATLLIRLALIVAIGLTFAGAGLLLSSDRAAEERDPDQLRSRVQWLHGLLYSGAGVLVAGVLQVGALHHWALASLAPAEAEPLVPLVDGFSMVVGTYWTLVLFGFYTPVAVLLKIEAGRLARRCLEGLEEPPPKVAAEPKPEPTFKEVHEWLEKRGLASNPKQIFVRVGALLGPFLAGGPLGALVEFLKV